MALMTFDSSPITDSLPTSRVRGQPATSQQLSCWKIVSRLSSSPPRANHLTRRGDDRDTSRNLAPVARFVPDEALSKMLAVNSVFFDLAMDIRWKQVVIVTRNTSEVVHILARLSDPFVASRLQSLVLRLTQVKDSHVTKNVRHQMRATLGRALNALEKRSLESRTRTRRGRPTFIDVVNGLIACAPKFVNIRQLTIDSWYLPPSYYLQALYKSFWTSFGANLQYLSLGGNVEGCRSIIESKPVLGILTELQIELTNNLFREDLAEDAIILVNILAPFINSLSPRLEALRIWSWANLNLSDFFLVLSPFPALKHLNVRMAFNKALQEPSGLKSLLCASSQTLHELNLRLNPASLPLNFVDNATSEMPLGQWLLQCVGDERCFSHLRVLDIYPTNTPAGMEFLLASIKRTSKSILELTIRDRYLQHAEVVSIVDAISECSGLAYLRMNIWRLDIVFIDYIAAKLPNLHRLWLSVGETLDANTPDALGYEFPQELKQRTYKDWKLRDLSVWQGGAEVGSDVMFALAGSIPSLQSFFEHGHMHL
ncbi:hypothetical protein BDZ97DRAFT_1016160 [Flammula alnicola]|nr:hypothetical protein BDZ97DRAFT_1016160 [Flammula alnicola]